MEIKWLPFATEQLAHVIQYVADEFGRSVALRTLKRIQNKVNRLQRFPESGTWDKAFSTSQRIVRHLNIYPNIVFYLIDEDEVVVISVMHCKQSPQTMNRTIEYAIRLYHSM